MKILLACGGTGGHIFPAFSVAEELKRRHPDAKIIYACGKKDIESAIFKIVQGEKVVRLEAAPFVRKGIGAQIIFLWKLIKGFLESVSLILREKPDVVVGFGGYSSFPVVMAAKCLGKKTLLHEQNVIPGVANKMLARWVDGVAISFLETQNYWPRIARVRLTGNPIRSSIERECRKEALTFFSFEHTKFTLLVLGGSQGAESVNTLFLGALKYLSRASKDRIQVIHLCGKMKVEEAEAIFRENQVPARVFSFFEHMDMAYGCTNLAIGRAGATFLAEIGAKAIPAILIPYPYANGHQLLNAKAFSKTNDGMVLEQKNLDEVKLAQLLEYKLQVVFKKGFPKTDIEAARRTNSRQRLTDFILETA